MQALRSVMQEIAEFHTIEKECLNGKGGIQIVGSVSSQKTHLMYEIQEKLPRKLIITANELKAKKIFEEYRFLDKNVYLYPAKDLLFYHADIKGKLLLQQRMEVVKSIMNDEKATIIVGIDGLMDQLLPLKKIEEKILKIKIGQILDIEYLKSTLTALGYDREIQVDGVGQFAVRGGIIDIYPLTEEQPIRIEFWDDEVDSIRSFDMESQRSTENLGEVEIYPASESLEEANKISFLEYFDKKNTLLFIDEPSRIEESGVQVEEEFIKSMHNRMEQGMEVPDYEKIIFRYKEVQNKINKYSSIIFTLLDSKCGDYKVKETYHIEGVRVSSYNNSFEMLTRDLKRLKRADYRVLLLSGSRSRAKRIAEDLRDYDLTSFYSDDLTQEIKPGTILVTYGSIREGYEYKNLKFIVISESDIFGKAKKKKKRKIYEGQKISSFSELKIGDYVVHESHGLGIYQGIEQIERDKISKDYMKISYASGGNLYIPATQLNMIQKYASSDAKPPKLNKLGTQEWNKTKTRVRGVVKEIAKDLVALYAARQEQEGFVYGPDTVWQKEFEEQFPFDETDDQMLAIDATKRDMESTKIMDRLICGDVGYGKTEIAIRAAFKAAQESKQVVYLVPTTILAQQHYNNFVQRMKDFPVRIDLMCRFRTPSQQKKTIADTKKGMVDILIGTHRLLSKDLEYKNLGLLIVDEEQRFGVQHKEKIKQLKENIDVMTLTATPIPRTLHMSLIGIRDMSVLEEAPQDRLPIQTYVMEYNDEMVREAIERELARDGQVYYVYNKVKDIDELTNRIAKLVPDANVAFAHGQMKEHELERIMMEFINGDIDVLVSTTIIETGLDISNANTMIIHDSDQLGLSQLYQLRGRVGRSNRMAYAFLLYRRDKMLKEVAEKRLAAIREFTDLGSGFKIAMRDLEIRGAGNLLGAQQHGHMEAVGYDLFCKMLNEAVKMLKGEITEEPFETTLDINVDAYIPTSYITNEYQKLDVYKRIASIENEEEMDDMLEEMIDRFGDVPRKVQQLLQVALLRSFAHSASVVSVEQKNDAIKITMFEKAKVEAERIPLLLAKYKGDLTFKIEVNPYFIYEKKAKRGNVKDENIMSLVKNLLIDIKGLLV